MGKASSNKKVSRAARTGGGRTNRGRTPWVWYGSMAVIVALGLAGVMQSRHSRVTALAAGTTVAPRLASSKHPADHWHSAYGFYICDTFLPNLAADPEKGGIHTHADGLIHVEPSVVDDTGPHATLGRFLKLDGDTVTTTEIKIPQQKFTKKNGDKCGDKEGEVKVFVDGQLREGDPNKIRLKDGQKIVVAFVPKDVDKVPEPPSVSNLSNPNANEAGANPATAPGATPATAPGDTSVTTAPGGATATTAPAGTTATTAAPAAGTATTAPATTAPATTAPASSTPPSSTP